MLLPYTAMPKISCKKTKHTLFYYLLGASGNATTEVEVLIIYELKRNGQQTALDKKRHVFISVNISYA